MNASLPHVVCVRHGETAWTITGQHTGRTDIPLTPRGESDAQRLGARLQLTPFATVLTSPLQRARRTAELSGFRDSAEDDADLMEWDYGAYEGMRAEDIWKAHPGWRLFEHGCPGGETLADVSRRADRVVARVRTTAGDVLVFAHGHILRILAARWIALPAFEARRLHLETASVSMLGYDQNMNEPLIRVLNSVPSTW